MHNHFQIFFRLYNQQHITLNSLNNKSLIMRIKITFLKQFKSPSNLPLHHQNTLYRCLSEFIEFPLPMDILFTFSPIKGTSTVFKGSIKFITNKVNLIISSNNEHIIQKIADRMFENNVIHLGKMNLIPKTKTIVDKPEFTTEMKYVCIAPIVVRETQNTLEESERVFDPMQNEFSDMLFNSTIERMHAIGLSEENLKEFDTFEIRPDHSYIKKIIETNKRFARFYKDNDGKTIVGYLFPFILHAHPKVHEFIYETGLGLYTMQGYGMVDIVKDNYIPVNQNQSSQSKDIGSDPDFDAIFKD